MRMHVLEAGKLDDVGLVFKLAVLCYGDDEKASASRPILLKLPRFRCHKKRHDSL